MNENSLSTRPLIVSFQSATSICGTIQRGVDAVEVVVRRDVRSTDRGSVYGPASARAPSPSAPGAPPGRRPGLDDVAAARRVPSTAPHRRRPRATRRRRGTRGDRPTWSAGRCSTAARQSVETCDRRRSGGDGEQPDTRWRCRRRWREARSPARAPRAERDRYDATGRRPEQHDAGRHRSSRRTDALPSAAPTADDDDDAGDERRLVVGPEQLDREVLQRRREAVDELRADGGDQRRAGAGDRRTPARSPPARRRRRRRRRWRPRPA